MSLADTILVFYFMNLVQSALWSRFGIQLQAAYLVGNQSGMVSRLDANQIGSLTLNAESAINLAFNLAFNLPCCC